MVTRHDVPRTNTALGHLNALTAGSIQENKKLPMLGNWVAIRLTNGRRVTLAIRVQKSPPSSPAFVSVIRLKVESRCIFAYTTPKHIVSAAKMPKSSARKVARGSKG